MTEQPPTGVTELAAALTRKAAGGDDDLLAALADQFAQLAMSLADNADQPLTQQRLVKFAVRGVPGAEHASVTVVDGDRPPRTTAQTDQQRLCRRRVAAVSYFL